MKQIKMKKLNGKIRVETGLHIGAGNDSIEIGGMDNPIIRDPFSREPYIPGSSLKGKMRSLSEWYLGKVAASNGDPCSCGRSDCPVCVVFGSSAERGGRGNQGENVAEKRGPTRLIVRDARLTDTWRKAFTGLRPIIEEKNENSLNRITAVANPRPVERVVPGVEFEFSIAYRVLDRSDGGEQDEKLFNDVVLRSLSLLEQDYLGGGGSRGNGKIAFIDLKDEEGKPVELPGV